MGLQFHTTIRDGSIELPESVRLAIHGETDFVVTLESEKQQIEAVDTLQYLSKHPLKMNSPRFLTREEAHERR